MNEWRVASCAYFEEHRVTCLINILKDKKNKGCKLGYSVIRIAATERASALY